MAVREATTITDKSLIDHIVNITEDDVTTTFIMELFAEFENGTPPKCRPYDLIQIPTGVYGKEGMKNKRPFTTTVGRWIFNKFFIERDLFDLFQYINKPVDNGTYGWIQDVVASAFIEDRITVDTVNRYLLKTQKIMPYVNVLSASFTEKMLNCSTVIEVKKQELLKKYEKEIKEHPEFIGPKIEAELIAYAKEYLKGDPSLDIFLSGARGSFGNNFKNMFVIKGVIRDCDPNAKQKYYMAESNYMNGIKPSEYTLFAKSLVAGPFKRSKKTAPGGYAEKLLLTASQHIKLGPPGSDCGTTRTLEVEITKKNAQNWKYSFVKEGDKYVELTTEVLPNYIGKKVHIRAGYLCKHKDYICEKCMGTLFQRIGRQNIGLVVSETGSFRKNKSMKAFHDSVETVYEMDVDKVFGY